MATTKTKSSRLAIGRVLVDATLRETHSSTAAVTEHPVEQGVNVSDHVRILPATLRIDGVVSTDLDTAEEALLRFLPEEAYAEFLRMQRTAELLGIITSLRTYENMVIRSVSAPRDAVTGEILSFTLNLTEIRITEITAIRIGFRATARVKPKDKKGAAATNTATPPPRIDTLLGDALGNPTFGRNIEFE